MGADRDRARASVARAKPSEICHQGAIKESLVGGAIKESLVEGHQESLGGHPGVISGRSPQGVISGRSHQESSGGVLRVISGRSLKESLVGGVLKESLVGEQITLNARPHAPHAQRLMPPHR